jgi:DNA invertase Pin-like site-specific DNA recombinase
MAPSKPKFVTYYRVSTKDQGRSGLGLEAQQATAKQYLAAHGGIELASFTEVESGKVNSRPQLDAALLRCRQTRATLLVAKLDRLSRNMAFLFRLRDEMIAGGMKFQALDIPEANTLTVGIMATLAQHEREIISARTKAALEARKARGLSLGTPRDLSAWAASAAVKGHESLLAKAKKYAGDIAPQIEAARAEGCVSLRPIAAWLNAQGIVTHRGKQWTAAAVRNVERVMQGLPTRPAKTAA